MRCLPVVLLEKTLYGHSRAGAFWQQYCTEICKVAGLRMFSDTWPCCYWHDETHTMLIVYVGDMKMSGPKQHLATRWANLGKGSNLTASPGDNELRSTFLGCDHGRSQETVKGKGLECLKWDATAGIRRGIAKYVAAVETVCPGWTPRMYPANVPRRHIETKTSVHRAPTKTDGDMIECPNRQSITNPLRVHTER